jgi:hypothetical protein
MTNKSRNRRGSKAAHHRDEAERTLMDAGRNPVLSAAESCAVAQTHALLAIEHRLAELCTLFDSAVGGQGIATRAEKPGLVATSPPLVA